jgi:hypothetical protein
MLHDDGRRGDFALREHVVLGGGISISTAEVDEKSCGRQVDYLQCPQTEI